LIYSRRKTGQYITFGDKPRVFTVLMSFLSPNQECYSTEAKSKHRPQQEKITPAPYPVFVCHWAAETRGLLPLYQLSYASIYPIKVKERSLFV